MDNKMTEQQKRFADYYIELANATDAYVKAGYKCKTLDVAAAASSRLLKRDKIRVYVEERNQQLANERVAGMAEVKEFWSKTLRDDTKDVKDRLKASEYIAKTNAAFVDKHEHSGGTEVIIINDIPKRGENEAGEDETAD